MGGGACLVVFSIMKLGVASEEVDGWAIFSVVGK